MSPRTQKITACAFVHEGGRMLAVRRSAQKLFLPNKWELVGGHIEFGETLEEGLAREIREELGVEAAIGEPFHAFTYLKNPDTHSVEIVYDVTLPMPGGISLDPAELQEYAWVSREEALALYDPTDAEYVAILRGFERIS